MVDSAGNSSATALAVRIGRNIKMLTKTFANYDHCISAAANFPITPQAIVNDALNCNWLNEGSDKNIGNLSKNLSALNFLGIPEIPVDHK